MWSYLYIRNIVNEFNSPISGKKTHRNIIASGLVQPQHLSHLNITKYDYYESNIYSINMLRLRIANLGLR